MMCTSPIRVNDGRNYMLVPCGQCIACRINKAKEWAVRVYAESRLYEDSIFVTLTYDDEHLPADGSVHKDELQRFMKRLRKLIYPNKVRYFSCGEYGGQFGRPHYHIILFGLSGFDIRVFSDHMPDTRTKGYYCKCKAWDKGLVHFGFVTPRSSEYVARYTLKKVTGEKGKEHYKELGIEPEFSLMSRRPGIGLGFMDKFRDELLSHGFLVFDGSKKSLPRYFRDKLDIKSNFAEIMRKDKKFQEYLKSRLELSDEDFLRLGKLFRDELLQRDRNNKERYKQ